MDESLILPGALALMVVLIGLMFVGDEDKSKKRVAAMGSKSAGSQKSMFSFLKSDERIGFPRWILNGKIKRRQKKFTAHFADAMEIIVRGVRTGLPLGDCLKIIAHESPEPVRSEFQLVVEGESVGVPIEVCLERMYERIPLSEVNFFATVLNIQRSTGGNLGESLANLANVLRGRKVLRQKIKALAAEAKVSAGIIAALPPILMVLIVIVSPDYMEELFTTSTGQRNLMIGAGMMVTGTLVMKKMINFKV